MIALLLFFSIYTTGFAKLVVWTTTSDIRALTEKIANNNAKVSSLLKGTQDPHFIEAKPSYMVKLQKADLLISNGLSLESGWLPNLILGARNPKINPGSPGYLELGQFVSPLDSLSSGVTRAMGHVHPEGNPHFMLDPEIAAQLGFQIAQRLSQLDPENKDFYQAQAKKHSTEISALAAQWKKRVTNTKVKQVITYHASLNYFLKSMGLRAAMYLEAKPGSPPSAQHILKVIELMNQEKIDIILVDNFFDTKLAEKIAQKVPGARIKSVGISVDSDSKLLEQKDVFEQLVVAIEGK